MKEMKLVGKKSKRCECCLEFKCSTYFFDWFSLVSDDYLCTICFQCARREMFGSKYKYNKRYDRWVEEIKGS